MRSRALTVAVLVLTMLALLYALAGFLLIPYLVQKKAPGALAETGHRLRLGEFRFNPFTLSLQAHEISIEDKEGRPVFSAAQAFADLEWRSLVRRGWVLSAVHLLKPALNVEIDQQGRVNLATLARDDGEKREALPRFYIGELKLEDGVVEFADKRESYANRFEQLSLSLSELSTLQDQRSGYRLDARTPDGAKLQWEGEVSLQPISLSGKLLVSDIALPALSTYVDTWLAGRITAGRGELELPHRLLVREGRPQLLLDKASATVTGLAVEQSETAPLKLRRFAIQGMDLDTLARSFSAQLLRIEGLSAGVQRKADGTLDLAGLLRPRPEPPKPPANDTKWRVTAARAEVAESDLHFTDVASGLVLALEGISARVSDWSLDSTKPLPFEIEAAARGGGRLSFRGRTAPGGNVSGRIEAAGLPLSLLQPLIAERYRMRIATGEAALAGEIEVGGKAAKFSYRGSAALNNLAINEAATKGEGARLLGWKALATDKLELSLSPDRVAMDELRLTAPRGRLHIAPDRSINFRRVLATAAPKETRAEEAKPPPAAEKPEQKQSAGFAVVLRRLRVAGGQLDFSDDSLTPGFDIAIQELAGTFNGLSSDRSTRSQFSLEGRVGEFGYARLTGALNPFEWRDRTTLRVEFRNLDMTRISPYAMKFAGYRIASGRLSLDLRYRINDSIIVGENQAVLDQMVLGERVQSPDALDLPIELAVSLLKDDQGRIDIAVPVTGNLEDPQFDYGALIRRAISNLISRIVTAPFRALASLFGGGQGAEEVGAIAFEPGQARLLPPEREKIKRVAEGLAKRPEVKILVPGRADSEADGTRLKRAALAREIAKRAGFAVAEDETAGGLSIEDRRTRTAIRELFAERFSSAELSKLRQAAEARAREANAEQPAVLERLRNLATGEPQVTDARPFYSALMRRLRETQPLPADALEQLAQQRAQAIATALREAGVAEERIGTSIAEPTADPKAKEVRIELALGKKN